MGGPSCSTVCGGRGEAASYGKPGMPKGTPCTACSAGKTGYSFSTAAGNDAFAPAAVARLGATAPGDCLAEFSQTEDAAWYLPYAGGVSALTVTPGVGTFGACAALCSGSSDCQFFTYDYTSKTCNVKLAQVPVTTG